MKVEQLGEFNIESGKVFVSDPCYDLDTTCAKVLENVKKGKWIAEADVKDEGSWGKRVSVLRCFHESVEKVDFEGDLQMASNDIGVDSGQAGIFDIEHFKKDVDAIDFKRQYKKEPICENEPWYSMCCDVTISKGAGVIPFGVVSSSGMGDGCYTCKVGKNDGEISLIEIDFGLNEMEEEEERKEYKRLKEKFEAGYKDAKGEDK